VRKQTFSDWLNLYHERILCSDAENKRRKRIREGAYPELEAYLVRYLETRKKLFKLDKLGLHYDFIKEYVLEESEKLLAAGKEEYSDFKASNRWIQNVCLRNGFVNLKTHGEGGDIDELSAAAAMKEFTEQCT
jgi:hypothetical protein